MCPQEKRFMPTPAPRAASGAPGIDPRWPPRTKEVAGRKVLMAYKGQTWLALGSSAPLLRRSCGYVGASDGWTDLNQNYQMDWEFDVAEHGNIALTAEIDHRADREFTLALSLGNS